MLCVELLKDWFLVWKPYEVSILVRIIVRTKFVDRDVITLNLPNVVFLADVVRVVLTQELIGCVDCIRLGIWCPRISSRLRTNVPVTLVDESRILFRDSRGERSVLIPSI